MFYETKRIGEFYLKRLEATGPDDNSTEVYWVLWKDRITEPTLLLDDFQMQRLVEAVRSQS